MSNLTRREWLSAASASCLAGTLNLEAAQAVHQAVAADRKATAPHAPKFFQQREFKSLTILADVIVPADEESKGALDAGAPEFIDLLCSQNDELGMIYTGGLGWLDATMRRRYTADFIDATREQRFELLNLIAYRRNESHELGPGIRFFVWVRKMVVDAYYTHPAGIAQVGYIGNTGMTTFHVPAEAIVYALNRSPFRRE
jgi:hypothetical protein